MKPMSPNPLRDVSVSPPSPLRRRGADRRARRLARKAGAVLTALAAGLGACALPGAGGAPEPAPGLLITGATLLSPERSEPLENAWVGIREGRIAFVGAGALPPEARDLEHLPAEGLYLIPGLVDGHVHLDSIPGMAFPQRQARGELVRAYLRQMPRSYLYHGFTTLVDLGAKEGQLHDLLGDAAAHPDLYGCGGSLPLANGYPMRFAPPEVRFDVFPNFLYDPRQVREIPARYSPEDHGPGAAVARVRAAAGRCVKTFVEDGFGLESSWPTPTVEILREVRDAAHGEGLPLAVHANSYDAYRTALDGGADILVHGLWTWDGHQAEDDGRTLPEAITALLDRLVEEGVASMPTLRVIAGDRALFDPGFLQDPALPRVLPAELVRWYGSEEGQWFGRQLLKGLPPDQATARAAFDGHTAALRRVQRATARLSEEGAPLLFGSDTPSGPSYGNPPGLNGYWELRAWAAVGIPLDRIFAAATLETAKAFGLEDRYGTVEAGKVANLLLLRDDPLQGIDAYDSIRTVILGGRPIDRADLSATAPQP